MQRNNKTAETREKKERSRCCTSKRIVELQDLPPERESQGGGRIKMAPADVDPWLRGL